MTPEISFPVRVFGACLLGLLAAASVAGQNVLITKYKGKPYPVVAVDGDNPYIEVDGKRVWVQNQRYGLNKVDEYLPIFISVRDVRVEVSQVVLMDVSHGINNRFNFEATFESAYALNDVFLVLELDSLDAGKFLYLRGVGRLEAREPKRVSVTVLTKRELGQGNYQLHLFTGGMEVFNTTQQLSDREQKLDQMVARRVKSATDAKPRPFVGPPPEYPKSLRKARVKGAALVEMDISATGVVANPEVVSATDPAFGEAALEAVRQWRFLPEIKAGRPVGTHAKVPFNFTPPAP